LLRENYGGELNFRILNQSNTCLCPLIWTNKYDKYQLRISHSGNIREESMQSQTAIIQTLESDDRRNGCLLTSCNYSSCQNKKIKIFQLSVFISVINFMQNSDYMQNENCLIGETMKRSAVHCANCQQIWRMKCHEWIKITKSVQNWQTSIIQPQFYYQL
jgi:hypothetical protein